MIKDNKDKHKTLQAFLLALDSGDEKSIISFYDEKFDSELNKAQKAKLVLAFKRLSIFHLLQEAIDQEDDITILRWYHQELFHSSSLLSKAQKARIDIAYKRVESIAELRNFTYSTRNNFINIVEYKKLLSNTNLISKFELNKLLENTALIMVKNSTMSEQQPNKQQIFNDWLNNFMYDSLDAIVREDLNNDIQLLGFSLRVQRALSSNDIEWLEENCSNRNSDLYQTLQTNLKEEVQERISKPIIGNTNV